MTIAGWTARVSLPVMAAGLLLGLGVSAQAQLNNFTSDFFIEKCSFSNTGANAIFSLKPGSRWVLQGDDNGATVTSLIHVTNQTEKIDFVTIHGQDTSVVARVVQEWEWEDGDLVEVSWNWMARCTETNDIFYFGEWVNIYENGNVSHDGSWRAGVNGAQPGVIYPGSFMLGARYQQEFAPGVAEDQGRNSQMGLDVEVPAGSFTDCVEVIETTPLDPTAQDVKVYCPGVGPVKDEDLELTTFGGCTGPL